MFFFSFWKQESFTSNKTGLHIKNLSVLDMKGAKGSDELSGMWLIQYL